MHTDVHRAFALARNETTVPPVPLDAIRAAAAAPVLRSGRTAALAATVAVASLALVAAGSVLRTQIGIGPAGQFVVSTPTVRLFLRPSEAQVRAIAGRVDFPVQWPSGLPAGTTIAQAGQLDGSALFVAYNLPGAWRRSDHLLWVFLANPRSVGAVPREPPRRDQATLVGRASRHSVRWHVGGEDVIVASDTITPAELRHLKDAMLAEAAGRR